VLALNLEGDAVEIIPSDTTRMSRCFSLLTILSLTGMHLVAAEQPQPEPTTPGITVTVWPKDKIPGKVITSPERAQPDRGDHVTRLTDIAEPSFTVFKAASTKPTPAVIICPGGGYSILAYNKEGTEIAAWLNTIGITGIVLKYRVPNNQEGAFQDIQRTIRLVRHRATEWNLARDHVGVMGFSAGGHLSAKLSTLTGESTYTKIDAIDEEPLHPDFALLVYPAYLIQGMTRLVDAKTSPTFIVHAEDDKSFIAGSKVYTEALEKAQVPHEFFQCATGGHGHGLRSEKEVKVWPLKCQDWLKKIGVIN
jgi:acetyl esterase/lipase